MAQESRLKKSFLNVRMNFLTYFVALVVSFFTRQIFLSNLGLEFMGLSETLGSILSFLNLAELGIGSAIAYVLYKPLYEGDQDKIKELVSLQGVLYRSVGFLILTAGIVISLFLPRIFPDTSFDYTTIYVGYYSYLGASVAGYILNYKTCLLVADQKNYLVTGYYQFTNISRILIQVLLCVYVKSFILYFLVHFAFSMINVAILNIKIKQTYPWLKTNLRNGFALLKKYPEVYKKTGQIFIHKMGDIVQSQITPILIYKFISLATVTLYTNYTIVTVRMKMVIGMMFDGITASVGNLIAEGNKEKTYEVFKEMFSFKAFLSGVVSLSTVFLITPFVSLWLGEQYLLSIVIPIIISVHMYFEMMWTCGAFIMGFGLFADVWAPVVETVLVVVLTIVGGYLWGLPGVLLGLCVPKVAMAHIWKPIYLFTRGFKMSILKYYVLLIKYIILLIPSGWMAYWLNEKLIGYDMLNHSWGYWIGGAFLFAGVLVIVYFSLLYVTSCEFRKVMSRFKLFAKSR